MDGLPPSVCNIREAPQAVVRARDTNAVTPTLGSLEAVAVVSGDAHLSTSHERIPGTAPPSAAARYPLTSPPFVLLLSVLGRTVSLRCCAPRPPLFYSRRVFYRIGAVRARAAF